MFYIQQLDLADMDITEAPSLHQILISAIIEEDESKEMSFHGEEKYDFLCAIDDSHSVDENDIGSVEDKLRVQLQRLDFCRTEMVVYLYCYYLEIAVWQCNYQLY